MDKMWIFDGKIDNDILHGKIIKIDSNTSMKFKNDLPQYAYSTLPGAFQPNNPDHSIVSEIECVKKPKYLFALIETDYGFVDLIGCDTLEEVDILISNGEGRTYYSNGLTMRIHIGAAILEDNTVSVKELREQFDKNEY